MPSPDNKRNGGLSSRLGKKFHEAIEKIKDAKLRNGTVKERLSTEKITNLITSHNSWEEISKHIIEAKEEEVRQYGL